MPYRLNASCFTHRRLLQFGIPCRHLLQQLAHPGYFCRWGTNHSDMSYDYWLLSRSTIRSCCCMLLTNNGRKAWVALYATQHRLSGQCLLSIVVVSCDCSTLDANIRVLGVPSFHIQDIAWYQSSIHFYLWMHPCGYFFRACHSLACTTAWCGVPLVSPRERS